MIDASDNDAGDSDFIVHDVTGGTERYDQFAKVRPNTNAPFRELRE
jgi:hypothetical protein